MKVSVVCVLGISLFAVWHQTGAVPEVLGAQAPVIDSFSASPSYAAPGETLTLAVEAHDPDCPDVCDAGCSMEVRADLTSWSADSGTFVAENNGTSGSPYTATADWQAPAEEGTSKLTVSLADSGSALCGGRQTASATLDVRVSASATSVTYNGNGSDGGTVPVDGGAYMPGDSVTVLENTGALEKSGYAFSGWNTAADGSGTAYSGGDTFTMGDADVTLFAQWNEESSILLLIQGILTKKK